MATHLSVQSDPTSEAIEISETDRGEVQLFRIVSKGRDVVPVAYMPPPLAESSKAHNLRRVLTREQGRALEMIGHAVDYLNDCYLYEGDEHELINTGGSCSQAMAILIAARGQILQAAPLQEPRMYRLWKSLFHRNCERRSGIEFHRRGERTPQSKPTGVLPLS